MYLLDTVGGNGVSSKSAAMYLIAGASSVNRGVEEVRTSAIIPTFNRPDYLQECLTAVMSQTIAADEIIIVDDGSDDPQETTLRSRMPGIKFLRQANAGKSVALNNAIAASTGDLIWIVDDDDIPLPHCLEMLKAALRQNDADLAYGRHTRFSDMPDGSRKLSDTGYWKVCDPSDFLVETLLDFFTHHPGMLVRREMYDRVGVFNTELIRSQDYEMTLRLARAAKASGTNEVVFLQRQHSGSRGRGQDRISADQVKARWIAADASIFREIYNTWSLKNFLPGTHTSSDRNEIISLLYRASTMARKKLWDLAILDWREACLLSSCTFNQDELEIVKLAMSGKYGIDEILEDQTRKDDFDRIYRDPMLMPIRRALARGMLWRIRESFCSAQPRKALGFTRVALKLAR